MQFWMTIAAVTIAVLLTHAAGAQQAIPPGLVAARAGDGALKLCWLVLVLAAGAVSRQIICGTCRD